MATLLWQERGASITHSIPNKSTTHAHFASLPVKDGEVFDLSNEYFLLELGAVSSLINNKGVSEHEGVKTKTATHEFLSQRQMESCH